MEFQLSFPVGDAHVRNHNAERNTVNVTAQGLNAPKTANAVIATMVSQKLIIIIKAG